MRKEDQNVLYLAIFMYLLISLGLLIFSLLPFSPLNMRHGMRHEFGLSKVHVIFLDTCLLAVGTAMLLMSWRIKSYGAVGMVVLSLVAAGYVVGVTLLSQVFDV